VLHSRSRTYPSSIAVVDASSRVQNKRIMLPSLALPHISHLTSHTSHLTTHTSHLTTHNSHLLLHACRHCSAAILSIWLSCSGCTCACLGHFDGNEFGYVCATLSVTANPGARLFAKEESMWWCANELTICSAVFIFSVFQRWRLTAENLTRIIQTQIRNIQ
jgi:hypothetical protein